MRTKAELLLFAVTTKTEYMTELIVSLEDNSMLADIKKAIRMLRGVASVRVSKIPDIPNATTIKAIKELECGDTVVCENFEEYLKLVDRELSDNPDEAIS